MEEARDRKLVQTMIGMAHDLGFRVVAEGIETGEVYRLLKNWNCDEAQGYWMARPMPADDFVRWYREHATMPTDAARVA
jgi:EAL domain-containing protein (putative c-di-GMP-specific phosphodiesterase class I)